MGRKDPRVDAYIEQAAPFARPILEHLRGIVHAGCPDVEETLRWSTPAFMYKGMLCGMAAFQRHATFGFWKHALIAGEGQGAFRASADAMGQFGCNWKYVRKEPPSRSREASSAAPPHGAAQGGRTG